VENLGANQLITSGARFFLLFSELTVENKIRNGGNVFRKTKNLKERHPLTAVCPNGVAWDLSEFGSEYFFSFNRTFSF